MGQTDSKPTDNQTNKKKPDIIPTILSPSLTSQKIQIISVDEEYMVENGVSGMRRDIILRLCCLFLNRTVKIRLIIGMSKEHYQWKDHSYFLKRRSNGVFRSTPQSEIMNKTQTAEGVRFEFSKVTFQTVFLDLSIVKGILEWKVKIKYQLDNAFYFCVVPADYLSTVDSGSFVNSNGTCSLYFGVNGRGKLFSSFLGLDTLYPLFVDDTLVPDNAVLTAEVDADKRTISFFVKKTRARVIITDLHIPVYLGVVGNRNATQSGRSSFTSLSVRRLMTATPSSLPYVHIKCSPKVVPKKRKK